MKNWRLARDIVRLRANQWTPGQIAEVCGVTIRTVLRVLLDPAPVRRQRPWPVALSKSERAIWRDQVRADGVKHA